MSVVFTRSPIIETVCDFQFAPGQPWDWTVPGLFYERVRNLYPLKQEHRIAELNMPFGLEGQFAQPQITINRLQFLRENRRALVQIGPNFLAVNHLRPYPTWQPYRQMIFENLAHYAEVAQPGGIQRIGLRYINQIEFPAPDEPTPFPSGLYTKAVPGLPDALLSAPVSGFLQHVEIPSSSGQGVLVLQSGTVPSQEPNSLAFILDLAFTASYASPVLVETAHEWIEQAHRNIEEAFLACITPQARQLFGEITNG